MEYSQIVERLHFGIILSFLYCEPLRRLLSNLEVLCQVNKTDNLLGNILGDESSQTKTFYLQKDPSDSDFEIGFKIMVHFLNSVVLDINEKRKRNI